MTAGMIGSERREFLCQRIDGDVARDGKAGAMFVERGMGQVARSGGRAARRLRLVDGGYRNAFVLQLRFVGNVGFRRILVAIPKCEL